MQNAEFMLHRRRLQICHSLLYGFMCFNNIFQGDFLHLSHSLIMRR